MFLFNDESGRMMLKKWMKGYLWSSVMCLLFGLIYEIFSHGVYSVFMLGAFLVPLLFGALPLAFAMKKPILPGSMPLQLLGCSVLTLSLGSVFKGILDIYGTTNGKVLVFASLGGILFLAFFLFYFSGLRAMKRKMKA